MSAIVGPKPIVLQRLAAERARREAEGQSPDAVDPSDELQDELEDDDDDDDDDDEDGEANE